MLKIQEHLMIRNAPTAKIARYCYMIQQLSAALRDEQQLYYITQHGQPFGGPAAPTTPLDPPLHKSYTRLVITDQWWQSYKYDTIT